MKNIIRLTILMGLALLASAGCVKHTERGDTFEATFSLTKSSFTDGDEFGFTVTTNRSKVRVLEFDFDLSPDMVKKGDTYSVSDGRWTVTENVVVPTTQRGTVSITIQDPDTGAILSFEEGYTAFQAAGITLLINNNPFTKTANVQSDHPGIVSGDDFTFTVKTNAESLILTDYLFKYNNGILEKGKEYFADEYGKIVFTVPSVEVGVDQFTEAIPLTLTFRDPETNKTTTVTDYYYTALAFNPEVTITPSVFLPGDVATVKITSNRNTFTLLNFSAPEWFKISSIYGKIVLTLAADGYVTYKTDTIIYDTNTEGEILFSFQDNAYTNRQKVVKVPYTTNAPNPPSKVNLSATEFALCTGETLSVNVSTDEEYTTNQFVASVASGNEGLVKVYAPENKSETIASVPDAKYGSTATVKAGLLYIKAFDKAGSASIRVKPDGNENVYADITGYVRQDVALKISGSFIDWLEMDPDGQLDNKFSNDVDGPAGIGWLGFPLDDMTAELVTYNVVNGGSMDSVPSANAASSVTLTSVTKNPWFIAQFKVEVKKQFSGRYFYGMYKNSTHKCLNGTYDPRYYLLEFNWKPAEQYPKSSNPVLLEDRGQTPPIKLSKLTEYMRELDCNIHGQIYGGFFNELRWNFEDISASNYEDISISVESLDYDHNLYNVKYILYTYWVPEWHGPVNPWWYTVDAEKKWVVPFTK